MDRGRDRVGGPDEIEAATDDRGEPARGPDREPTAEGPATGEGPGVARAGGDDDGALAASAGGDDAAALAARAGGDDDGPWRSGAAAEDEVPPAVWLADVRARAPWLVGPDGALRWRTTGPAGPDRVPHGMTPTEPWSDATDRVDRTETAGTGATPPSWSVSSGRAARSSLEKTAGDAGGPGASEAGTTSSDAKRRSRPPAESADLAPGALEPSTRGEAPWAVEPDVDPRPERTFRGSPTRPWPALELPRTTAGDDPFPSYAEVDEAGPPQQDPLPDPDPRRPAIHRSSATWSPSRARPPASSPVWPPRLNPDGADFLHQGAIPEPNRPMHRPVTPFVPDRPGPASTTNPPPRPTWAEDRSGWHALAVPPARGVDETALPPWPTLLDDDDGEEPDWAALERGYERMLRLDREQRRR